MLFIIFFLKQDFDTFAKPYFEAFLCFSYNNQLAFFIYQNKDLMTFLLTLKIKIYMSYIFYEILKYH